MAQKIKKQFKRSLPIFLILCIVSLSVSGFFFSFNLKIKNFADKMVVSLIKPEASAQDDSASTTVTVRNAEPTWNIYPTEVPVSTSTSPVNVGAAISFSGRGDDPETNSYYLIVCSAPGVAVTAGNPPTCTATMFCRSGSPAANATDATCTYANVADPAAETEDWYAYLCDNHPTEPECSAMSQGSAAGVAASSSPFYVNHAPGFTNVYTSLDNQDPGGTFTFTASTTDTDVLGGDDVLTVDVCGTQSWATTTGCTVPLCTGTSTTDVITCSHTIAPVVPHGPVTYYAYVKDWHEMPSAANDRSSTYTVNNVAPVVSGVAFNGNQNVVVNMKLMADALASSSAQVTDNNGCSDIVSATSTLYWSGVAGAENCADNDNDCYQIPAGNCTIEVGSCLGGVDPALNFICTTTMAHYTKPSDSGSGFNPDQATNWLAGLRASDGLLTGIATSAVGREVVSLSALDVSEPQIPYGSIKSNANSGATNATTTITNYGNSPLDSQVEGTDMTGPGTVEVNNQEYNTINFTWGTGTDLASTSAARVNIDTPRPTSLANVADPIYWGIGIPAGRPSGNYSGTNTFYAAIDDSGGGW